MKTPILKIKRNLKKSENYKKFTLENNIYIQAKFKSVLTIHPISTADEGKYTCCGSAGTGSAVETVCTSSQITVSFVSSSDNSSPIIPEMNYKDSCFNYDQVESNSGIGICQEYLEGKEVHAEKMESISQIEKMIKAAISQLHDNKMLSRKCGDYAPKARVRTGKIFNF